MQIIQSDWLSYSYTISHYSSTLNFPLVQTDHMVRSRAGTICQKNALGRLSDVSITQLVNSYRVAKFAGSSFDFFPK